MPSNLDDRSMGMVHKAAHNSTSVIEALKFSFIEGI